MRVGLLGSELQGGVPGRQVECVARRKIAERRTY